MERSKARPITINVRPEVAAFAQLRETKLSQNDHKPSWRDCTPEWLLARLVEEAEELRQAIFWDKDPQHIAEEAADVANFANFIADVVGGLVLDTESVGSTIELNKNMSTTKDSETDIPVWRCPRLDEIRARAEAATLGPWKSCWEHEDDMFFSLATKEPVIDVGYYDGYHLQVKEEDAAFIAHSRQDIPDLLSEIDRLQSLLGDLEEFGCGQDG